MFPMTLLTGDPDRESTGGSRRAGMLPWKFLLLLFAAGLAARIAVSLLFGDNHSVYYEYMVIAKNILEGKGYSFNEWDRTVLQPSSFLPPGYVFWCWLWMGLSHANFLAMYVAQAAVAASGVLPAYLLGREMFSARTGKIFAVAYTFFPEMLYLHSRPDPEFLYVVLVLWMLYLYLRLRDTDAGSRQAVKLAVMLGLVGGINMLIKEGAAVVIAATGVMLLWEKRPLNRVFGSHIVPYAAVVLLILLPWMIRNTVVHKHFVPIRNGYGITMWIANHHGATGTDKTLDGKYVWQEAPAYYQDYMNRMLPPDEWGRDKAYRAEVRRFVMNYPVEYASLCAKRLWYFLWFDPTHPIARNIVYRAGYILLLLVSIPGIVIAIRRRKLDPVFPLIYLGYIVLYVPVLVLPRYRIIPVVMLLLLASYAVSVLLERRRKLLSRGV